MMPTTVSQKKKLLPIGGFEVVDPTSCTEYIKERDKSNKILKKARREFEKKLFKEVKKNPKALYRYLNSGKQGRVPICRLRRRNLGTETLNDKESAEELNDFFSIQYL